jgi:hypothetical protein
MMAALSHQFIQAQHKKTTDDQAKNKAKRIKEKVK